METNVRDLLADDAAGTGRGDEFIAVNDIKD
jgi:hypothetical protein